MDKTFYWLKKLSGKFLILGCLILPQSTIAAPADAMTLPIAQVDLLSSNQALVLATAPPPPDVIRHPALATPPATTPEHTPAEAAPLPVAPMHTPGEAAQSLTGASPTPIDASPSPTEPGQSRHYRFH